MVGTIVNVFTVLVGSALGLIIGNRLPSKVRDIIIQSIGLFTLLIGITMIMKTTKFIEVFISLILGGITGELLHLDERLNNSVEKIKQKVSPNSPRFVEGFITATLVFCVGAMTVVGSIQEGLTHDATLLITKSIMDGITSLTLASGLGIGVMFSAISVFLIQGSLTLLGSQLQFLMADIYINNLTGLGGVLIVGIGLELLNIQKIKLINMLPSLLYLPLVVFISSLI